MIVAPPEVTVKPDAIVPVPPTFKLDVTDSVPVTVVLPVIVVVPLIPTVVPVNVKA